MHKTTTLMLAAGCFAGLSTVANAGEVVAKLIGEAGPAGDAQFEIALDGKQIGTGTVSPSVPTGLGGGVRSVTDLESVTRTFNYDVPDDELRNGKVVSVTFLNDKADPTTKEDGNLYVAALTINGVEVPLTTATIASAAGDAKPAIMVKAGLGIYWKATANFPVPAELVTAEANAPAATPAPAPAATCTTRAAVTITDFGNNARDVSAAAKQQLDAFAAEAGVAGCSLRVIGYASPLGGAAANQRISAGRAEAVATYLKGAGFPQVTSEGAGETQQFGPGPANRRVVVTVVSP